MNDFRMKDEECPSFLFSGVLDFEVGKDPPLVSVRMSPRDIGFRQQ
jgi:hypothetical protein